MNAMNMKLWEELKESFDAVNNDSTVRCIILSSTSKHFSSGMDLAVFAEMAQSHKQEKCPGRASEKLEKNIKNSFKMYVVGRNSVMFRCFVPLMVMPSGALWIC